MRHPVCGSLKLGQVVQWQPSIPPITPLSTPNPSSNIKYKNFKIDFIHYLQILYSLLIYHASLLNLKIPTNPTQRQSPSYSRTNLISLKDFIHHLEMLDSLLLYHTSLLNLSIQTNPSQRDSPVNSRTNLISLKDLIWQNLKRSKNSRRNYNNRTSLQMVALFNSVTRLLLDVSYGIQGEVIFHKND